MFRIQNLAPYRSRRFVVVGLAAALLLLIIFREEIEGSSYRLVAYNPAFESTSPSDSYGSGRIPTDPVDLEASVEELDGWDSLFSTPVPTTTAKQQPTPIPGQLDAIVNNFVTYPRLPPMNPADFEAMREDHINRLEEFIKHPSPVFPDYNVNQLKRLVEYWKEAGKDGNFEQPKVVLSSYGYIPCAMTVCRTTGEVIWLESIMNIFREHNYFLIWEHYYFIGKTYRQYGDIVTHVWLNDEHLVWCMNDTAHCVESEENPKGIPPWQLFSFTFWGTPPGYHLFNAPKDHPWTLNPLGSEWNLVPYQMPENQFYLGYHFTGCEDLPYIPLSERKDQILVLAKLSNYYHRDAFLHMDWWADIKDGIPGLDLISVAEAEDGYPIPEELVSLGPQERHAYDLMLGSSKALLGIGRPRISPSPFASLCRGVPVILPYKGRHCPARPNSTEWCGFHDNIHQHGAAARLGEPYVYMVDVQGPKEDIIDTIVRAVNTPIEPYIPPDMTLEAVTQRVKDYFSIDWKKFAARRMRENGWDRVQTQDYMYQWLESKPMQEQRES